jgi:hypothetical protein
LIYGGTWQGVNTDCSDLDGNGVADICENAVEVGACCYEVPGAPVQCVVTTDFLCQQYFNGDWKGPGTDCTDADGNGVADVCEEPADEGACCYEDDAGNILCAVTTESDCLQILLGVWKGPGTDCADLNGNGVADICEEPTPPPYLIEFSVDIGSDAELSDPFVDGDEGFDPGDVYLWQGPPVTPPLVPGGRDGFKDDAMLFGFDIFPDPPDPATPPATAVPVGQGSFQQYVEYFDLDGHDQLGLPLWQFGLVGEPIDEPIEVSGPTPCLHEPRFLAISFDDDQAPGWPAGDVPVTVPSPAGVSSYGTSAANDEVQGIHLAGPGLPAGIAVQYGLADEITVHMSLRPTPDGGEERDDDVDSLDVVFSPDECPFWYFSPDHEGTGFDPATGLPLDFGDIYIRVPGGPLLKIVDQVANLGLPERTDVDAFEFTVLPIQGRFLLALLFSVDEDDPLTPWDESGGRNPAMIYVSLLTGSHTQALEEPLADDVDAIALWREPLAEVFCLGDLNCDGVVTPADISPFVMALTNPAGYMAAFPNCHIELADCNQDGLVTSADISAFVTILTNGLCIPVAFP